MRAGGAKAASMHLRYIERDGVEKDGSKGVLYDAEGVARRDAFAQPRPGEKHQFRLIVSPEDAAELDLTAYVRRLMVTVQRDVGRPLEWAAVNHYNTGHPHAHVVIRGVDREGQELRMERAYIASGLRWRAQELATQELGPRRELDVRHAQEREVTQERLTSLDRTLERRARDGRVEMHTKAFGASVYGSTLVARLSHLERLRLAERLSPMSWKPGDGWQNHLRDLGARGDILQQVHAAVRGDPARYRVVRPGQPLPTEVPGRSPLVVGRVAAKGLSNELAGTFYAVVETATGRAYHVPLGRRAAEAVRPGDVVSLKTEPEGLARPVDRRIGEVARKHGGVYTVQPLEDGAPHPHERRLRELERLGLASLEAPGRWKVAPNVLEELAARQREVPLRHRLVLRKEPLSVHDQVRHPGPAWLDRVEADALAPYGFGAEVQRAVAERREALRRLGVDPDEPNRWDHLREVERRAVGEGIAGRSGQTFLARAPDGFRGRLQAAGAGPSEAAYAIVSDGQRFVLLRATGALRAAEGKAVTVTRDAADRLLVRPAPDKGLGS
jgi:type IV secretory pathway VirD2 relaxase